MASTENSPNAGITDARALRDRVRELLADDSYTLEECRDAMHRLGWTRYESLTSDAVEGIADYAWLERLEGEG